jgi:hypothetical protein
MQHETTATKSPTLGKPLAIPMSPVTSSQIKAVGYSEEHQTLAIQFKHGAGALYQYPNVSKETCEAFVTAESIGKYFGEHIKSLPFIKFPAEPAPESEDGPQSAVTAAAGGLAQTAVEA